MTSLLEALDGAAADLGMTGERDAGGSTVWAIAGRPFAALDATRRTASFLLDPVLVAAALRTPDTRRSPRGTDWIDLVPATVDAHAVDRAVAWFAAAARRAS